MIRNDFVKLSSAWAERNPQKMFTIAFHSLLLEMFSHRNEKWLWVLMITIAGSGLCTRRRRLWDAPLNCTFSPFFASSSSLLSCSPNFRSCPTPASIVVQTQTRGIEKGKKWRWFTRVVAQVSLYLVCTNTHLCITGAFYRNYYTCRRFARSFDIWRNIHGLRGRRMWCHALMMITDASKFMHFFTNLEGKSSFVFVPPQESSSPETIFFFVRLQFCVQLAHTASPQTRELFRKLFLLYAAVCYMWFKIAYFRYMCFTFVAKNHSNPFGSN